MFVIRCCSSKRPKDTDHSPHVVVPFIFVYFLGVTDCRSVRACVFTLYIVPRGVSSTLGYAHVVSCPPRFRKFRFGTEGISYGSTVVICEEEGGWCWCSVQNGGEQNGGPHYIIFGTITGYCIFRLWSQKDQGREKANVMGDKTDPDLLKTLVEKRRVQAGTQKWY